jgi:large subunit ribosomal protein L23
MEMSKDPTRIIRRPVITEKSTALRDKHREVCFEVAMDANKSEIKKAVEHLFKVKVESVRTQIKGGKERRVGRSSGWTSDWKKAIVRLKEGEKMIAYFEAM